MATTAVVEQIVRIVAADPSRQHYEEAAAEHEAAVADRSDAVFQFMEVTKQLHACYENIAREEGALTRMVDEMRTASDPSQNETELTFLQEVLGLLASGERWEKIEAEHQEIHQQLEQKTREDAELQETIGQTEQNCLLEAELLEEEQKTFHLLMQARLLAQSKVNISFS